MTAKTLVQIKDLKKHFPIRKGFFNKQVGAVRALDGINLDIIEGETLGLVGESGCGKSTLGRVMLRLLPATQGSVSFDGQEIMALDARAMKPLRKQMQIVFQNPYASLDPRMTIAQILAEPLEVHGMSKGTNAQGSNIKAEVTRLIELVGLPKEMLDRYPHEFSGGQRQRLAIARAIALEPEFILLDEPTSALDLSVQAQIIDLLRKLQADRGLSYLFISHDLKVVRALCHRVLVMLNGQIVEQGPVADVLENPQTDYTKRLVRAAFDIAT